MPERLEFLAEPRSPLKLPGSDGLILHGALLNVLDAEIPRRARLIHNRPVSRLDISMLWGDFESIPASHEKKLIPGCSYRFRVGIPGQDSGDVSRALTDRLLSNGLDLNGKTLDCRLSDRDRVPLETLFDDTDTPDALSIHFITPTSLASPGGEVEEMFPHRFAIFESLTHRWNQLYPDREVSLNQKIITNNLFEEPNYQSLNKRHVLVKDTGSSGKIYRHGFTGSCTYRFTPNCPIETRRTVTSLARFSSFCGIGQATARGCGTVEVEELQDG